MASDQVMKPQPTRRLPAAAPVLHKNGSTISVDFTITLLTDEAGGMIGIGAIMRDVTKRFEEMRALKRRLAEATKSSG